MFCPDCGNDAAESAFCSKCGRQLKDGSKEPKKSPASGKQSPSETAHAKLAESQRAAGGQNDSDSETDRFSAYREQEKEEQQATKPMSLGAKLAIAAVIVAVAVVAVVAVVSSNNTQREQNVSEAQSAISVATQALTDMKPYPKAAGDKVYIQQLIDNLTALFASGSSSDIESAIGRLESALDGAEINYNTAFSEADQWAIDHTQDVIPNCQSGSRFSGGLYFIRFQDDFRVFGITPNDDVANSVLTLRANDAGDSWVLSAQGDPVVEGQLGIDPESSELWCPAMTLPK